MGERANAIRAFAPAARVMNSTELQPHVGMHRLDLHRTAVPGQHCRDIQKPKPRCLCCLTINPCRLRNSLPQHRVPATDPENMTTASPMSGKVDVPSLRPGEIKLAPHVAAARQDDEIGIARDHLPRPQHGEAHPLLLRERVEIIEIRDPRKTEADEMQATFLARTDRKSVV